MYKNSKQFKLIGETDFRELFHKIVYVQSTEEVRNGLEKHIEICAEDDGFLAYGYIDNEAGFSFRILCSANIRNNVLNRGEFPKYDGYIIRRGYLSGCSFLHIDEYEIDTSDFDEYISEINDCYKCNEQTEEMRNFTFLDPLRHPDYPDDIKVVLYQQGMGLEQVWVKCYAYTDKELFGLLLNEPNQDFGIHYGSIIEFAPVKTEDGLLCVYTGRYREEQN